MNPNDVIRLRHIVDAIEEIQSFIHNKTLDDLFQNRQLTLSIIKLIEIIGEAASRVSQEI